MVATSEAPIQTTDFTIDRASYGRARVVDLLRKMWVWAGVGFLASLIGWAVSSREEPIHGYFVIALIDIPAIVFFVCVVVVARIWLPKNRHLFDRPRRFEFTSDHIAVSMGEFGEAKYSWQLITRISTVNDWTFLFQSQILAVAVPTSSLASTDLARFQALVESKKQKVKANAKPSTK